MHEIVSFEQEETAVPFPALVRFAFLHREKNGLMGSPVVRLTAFLSPPNPRHLKSSLLDRLPKMKLLPSRFEGMSANNSNRKPACETNHISRPHRNGLLLPCRDRVLLVVLPRWQSQRVSASPQLRGSCLSRSCLVLADTAFLSALRLKLVCYGGRTFFP